MLAETASDALIDASMAQYMLQGAQEMLLLMDNNATILDHMQTQKPACFAPSAPAARPCLSLALARALGR